MAEGRGGTSRAAKEVPPGTQTLPPVMLAACGTHRNAQHVGLGGAGGWREGERSRGRGPGCGSAPTRAGRLRQELMAIPHPAALAGINLTIYTHANQL